ncbi:hypothetical protein EMIT0P265_70346 [Pseudomonas zeae]
MQQKNRLRPGGFFVTCIYAGSGGLCGVSVAVTADMRRYKLRLPPSPLAPLSCAGSAKGIAPVSR